MKFKKLFIIIAPIILTILLIIVFYILFFRDINIQNSDNNLENSDLINNEEMSEENLDLGEENEENEENFSNTSNLEEGDPNKGLNIEIDGFKYCRYDEECFENLFLECNTGNHINFVDENSPYSFSIVNKDNNDCILLIQDLINENSIDMYCYIPTNSLNNENFNKILTLDDEVLNNYCK